MLKKFKVSSIILIVLALCLIWFFVFRTREVSVTYDSVEAVAETFAYSGSNMSAKMARNESYAVADTALGLSNALTTAPLYGNEDIEEESGSPERYRENKYYRVDTESFDNLIDGLTKDIESLKGTIKVNSQNSNKKVVYDRELHPRIQTLEFTVDNSETDLEKVEETFKKWGEIRISNSNKTSIEQELTNYEQQLKEMEEARKALQESKDKDWIARQDADYAKRSERIRNQIENAKKQSTYKTYSIDIYEVIKLRVNAVRYWYNNNYSLKNAIANVLPDMVKLFATLIPITVMIIVLVVALSSLYRSNKQKIFKDEVEMLKEEFDGKDIHFDIKM